MILALAALPAFSCANHPPQKKASASSNSSPQVGQPSGADAGSVRVLESVTTDSGTRALSNDFFTPSPAGNSSADEWTSEIK